MVELAAHFADIEKASEKGVKGLREWVEAHDPVPTSVSVEMHPREPHEDGAHELRIDQETLFRLQGMAGEGRNLAAYITDRDTVVKIVKKLQNARKNLLSAWAERYVQEAGIRVAKIHAVGPHGVYLEQEYVPGPSLEQRYGYLKLKKVPREIREAVLSDWRAAKKLRKRGIWLDLKSANYHQRGSDEIVCIDYTPRTNSTHYRYFKTDDGDDLDEDEFLDLFFHYDIRKCLARSSKKK